METELLKLNDFELAYHRTGEGSTVLLVHGITTYSFIWRNIIPTLAEKFDVIAIDLLGAGESSKPLDVDYSIKHHAEIIHEFITKLGIKRFHYVGHDLGGGIGQIFAVQYPEMLNSLTLINSVAYDFWPVQPITAMRTPVIRQFIMGLLDRSTLRLLVKRGVYNKDRVTPDLMEMFWNPLSKRDGRKAFLHFAKCLDNNNLLEIADDLTQLKIPVQILWGDADAYLSPEIARQLHAGIPGSTLVRITNAGHYSQEDEPEFISNHLYGFIADSDTP